jgi:hypothetical protein
MHYEASSSSRLLRRLVGILIAGLLTAGSVAAIAKSSDDLDIITVSLPPLTVSGLVVRAPIPGTRCDHHRSTKNGHAIVELHSVQRGI